MKNGHLPVMSYSNSNPSPQDCNKTIGPINVSQAGGSTEKYMDLIVWYLKNMIHDI